MKPRRGGRQAHWGAGIATAALLIIVLLATGQTSPEGPPAVLAELPSPFGLLPWPPGVPHTPDDVEPPPAPADFGFVLSYGVGDRNVLDTLKGTFTKDLVMDGTATTPLSPDGRTMALFYREMMAIGILDYASFEQKPGVFVTPAVSCRLQGMADGRIILVVHNGQPTEDRRVEDFLNLAACIRRWIESTEAFKKLPAVRSGYL